MALKITIGRVGKSQGHYIGRSGKGASSALGNPFMINRDGDRAEVIRKYKQWLWQQVQVQNPSVMNELQELLKKARSSEGVTLLCFCAPLACHGDVIKSCLEWMEGQDEAQA